MSTNTPFTLDDLTLNEYAILARKIKGDPMWALTAPDSTKGGEALAGLCWLHDRREQPGVKFEDYLTWSPKQARTHLGHDAFLEAAAQLDQLELDDESTEDDDDEADDEQTVLESATAAASEVAGQLVDPTTPPASPCSAT